MKAMTIVVSNVNDKVITTSETNADEPIRRTLPADTKGLANNGKLLLDRGEPLTNGTIVTHKTSSTLKMRRPYHNVTDNATPKGVPRETSRTAAKEKDRPKCTEKIYLDGTTGGNASLRL